VLCEDLSAVDGVAAAGRILAALNAPVTVDGAELIVTASVGVAFSGSNVPPQVLIAHADAAMYRAKERGRNCIELFDRDLPDEACTRLTIRTGLHRAVEKHEFRVFYQPVVGVTTGHIVGVEALARWLQPGGQLAMPASFIEAAEESGLIVPLGLQVLEEACFQAIRWRSAGFGPFTVSINMSARQVVDANAVDDLRRILRETGVDPSCLILEITESVLMEAGESTTTLRRLKDLGVGLAVDDFGTGYSSLSYLKRFPVDELKVDRSFVEGLGMNPEDSAIVAAVINLAHTLGLAAVAEGVETRAQLLDLRKLGCEAAQGFHLGRPVPPDQLTLDPG
jgi:EAL domain-containing protein (putative c-di-GMP-specific phosphodiesterase class I)